MAVEVKRPYELIAIISTDASIEDQKNIFKVNKEVIEANAGSIYSLETWGRRNLANEINKQKKGLYFHCYFESQPAAITEIERRMRINDKVLRFMHTRLDERTPIAKHAETFKKGLAESAAREREREAKIQARKAAFAANADS